MGPVPDLFRLLSIVITICCPSAVWPAAAAAVIAGSKKRARGTKHFAPMPVQLSAVRCHRMTTLIVIVLYRAIIIAIIPHRYTN